VKKLEPLYNRVIISCLKEEEISKGGIFIPDIAKEKPMQGKIMAVGEGVTENGILVPPKVKVGDLVLFSKYAGNEIKIEGEELLIVREPDILAIIQEV